MTISIKLKNLKSYAMNSCAALRRDSHGGTALMVGFAAPVILLAMGAGVDTGMWYLEKRKLQQVADTASLAAVRALADGASVSTAKAVAAKDAARNGYAADVTTTLEVNSPPISGAYAGNANAVEVVTTKKLPLFFSAYFMGASGKTLSARSVSYQSMVLGKNVEVSLMLDVSESMKGASEVPGVTKLQGMKDAAKSLVETVVVPGQTTYTARVALVPYSSAVNVGGTYYQAVTNVSNGSGWNTVVERAGSSAFTDDAPAVGKWLGEFRTKKNGAMGAYASIVKNYGSNVPQNTYMYPLSTDKVTLKAKIDAFTAKGTTAGHIGTAWAWYTLSPKWSGVFSGVNAPNAYDSTKTHKVAVLLSDFDMNSYYESIGDSTFQTRKLCTNMKAAGITVYTVAYGLDTGNSTAVQLWKDCASSPDHRFSTTTVEGMNTAFKAIAAQALGGAATISPQLVE